MNGRLASWLALCQQSRRCPLPSYTGNTTSSSQELAWAGKLPQRRFIFISSAYEGEGASSWFPAWAGVNTHNCGAVAAKTYNRVSAPG
eukprot:9531569-Heterocapsa_arctica.AAC.1